jgi:hypothetical protein
MEFEQQSNMGKSHFSVGEKLKYNSLPAYIINIKDHVFIKIRHLSSRSDWDRYFPLDGLNISNLPEDIQIGRMCTVVYRNVLHQVEIIEVYTGVMLQLHLLNFNENLNFWIKPSNENITKVFQQGAP